MKDALKELIKIYSFNYPLILVSRELDYLSVHRILLQRYIEMVPAKKIKYFCSDIFYPDEIKKKVYWLLRFEKDARVLEKLQRFRNFGEVNPLSIVVGGGFSICNPSFGDGMIAHAAWLALREGNLVWVFYIGTRNKFISDYVKTLSMINDHGGLFFDLDENQIVNDFQTSINLSEFVNEFIKSECEVTGLETDWIPKREFYERFIEWLRIETCDTFVPTIGRVARELRYLRLKKKRKGKKRLISWLGLKWKGG